MERMQEHGTLWICPWNQRGLPEKEDEWRFSYMGWVTLSYWFEEHAEWFEVGEWDEDRYACPYRLTAGGIKGLANRQKYDMEPVRGGLVGPGWTCIPAEAGAV